MFRGEDEINIDPKGRMAVPARYRDVLKSEYGGHLVVTIDMDYPCLSIYPGAEWEAMEERLNELPNAIKDVRRWQRLLIGSARNMALDSAGRVLVPAKLRTHAQLEKKVTLVGQSHRFELWDTDRWNDNYDSWLAEEKASDEIHEALQSLRI